MKSSLRTIIAGAAATASLVALTACGSSPGDEAAAAYPQGDIRFLVGVSPGGGFDTWARALAPHLEDALGNDATVVVENLTGAGGLRAANTLAAAEPDGYTIGITNTMGLTAAHTKGQTEFDVRHLTWLARLSSEPMAVLVAPDSGYESINDLAAAAPVRGAITSMGASTGIGASLVANTYGFEWQPVTHEGGSEASLSLVRGDTDFMVDSVLSRSGEIAAGDLVPILNLSEGTDGPGLEGVESATDQGEEELAGALNFARDIAAPPGLPDDVRDTLSSAIQEALASPELEEQITEAGLVRRPLNSQDVTASVEEMVSVYEEVGHLLETE